MGLSWRRACLVSCFLVAVLVGGAESQNSEKGIVSLNDDALGRICSDFFFGTMNKHAPLKFSSKKTRVRSDGTSSIHITTKDYYMIIDPKTEKVISWQNRNSHIPIETSDGRPVTCKIFENELAQLNENQAKNAAIMFISKRYGISLFENLTVSNIEKRITGRGFYWYISWEDEANEEGIHVGRTRINAMVNPINGEVINGMVMAEVPLSHPKTGIEHARRIADQEIEIMGLGGCVETESVRLVQVFHEGDPVDLEWRFSYQILSPCKTSKLDGERGGKVVRVLDSTGAVIH